MEWKYYKQLFLNHSKMPYFNDKISQAKSIIKNFPEKSKLDINNIYCTCSTGKDSTVLTILCNEIFPNIKVFSQKDNYDYPEELDYLKMLQKKFNLNLDIIKVHINLDEINFFEEIHKRGTTLSDLYFYSIIDKYKKENNFKGVFLGLRNEESKGRKLNNYKRGHTYQKKDGEWVCNPLYNWSGKDVFAYLLSNNIAPLKVYTLTKFCPPEKIRKSWFLPGARTNKGACLILKYYYPNLFKKLELVNQKIRLYI